MARKSDKSSTPFVDTGLLSFVTIANFHGINADPAQLSHVFAIGSEGANDSDIVKAARSLKLKARVASMTYEKLLKMPLPAIGKAKDGTYFVIAKVDANQALVLFSGQASRPKIIKVDKFKELWSGRIILCSPRFWKEEYHVFGFKWFLPVIRKYKRPLIDVLVAAFTLQVLGLFSPIVMQVVIDKVLTHHSYSTLDVLVVALIAIALFETFMTIAKNYIFTNTTSKLDVILGARLFRHLFNLPLAYFEARRVGDTVARVRELENIRQFLTGQPLTALLDTLFIVVYIVVMFIYSPLLTGIVLGSLVAYVILSAIVTPLFRQRLDERFNAGAESQSYLVESVSGAQTVKSLALEPKAQKKWEGLLANYTRTSYKTAILSGNSGAIGQLIQKIADLGILWFGAHLVIDGNISVGQLVAFRMLSGRVSGPVLRLVQMWQEFQQTGISIQRLGDIFNARPEPTVDATKTRLPMIEGRIRFEGVRFRYRPDAAEVIRDISFDIESGTVLGIVGRSGSGKSTLSKLIQRLYIPETGKILIDGVDIALADPAWLRRQIGIVLQENFLFNASIRENIAAQNPTVSTERIIQMAKIAGAHDFIMELPDAYDTMVGEHGTGLSGGQVQRIAIARALLNNPRILILDEATSALDYESESIIQRNLKLICEGRTVIIIAHRLSTLKDATKIMALDKGQVMEYDTPDELIKQKGLFYHLRSQQEKGL